MPEGVYIRQIPSAHVITNILHFRGLLFYSSYLKSVIVAFSYHVLFMFVMNESMKLFVSESLLWKQGNV